MKRTLQSLLRAVWPVDDFHLHVPLHTHQLPWSKNVAWSTAGLLAFAGPVVKTMTLSRPSYSVYIMNVLRPEEVAKIDTDHTATIRHLLWDQTGLQLLSVDDAGKCRLWAMAVCQHVDLIEDHTCNTWQLVYSHQYECCGVVAVTGLHTKLDYRTKETWSAPADAGYDSKYTRSSAVGPLVCPSLNAWVIVTADATVHVTYQDAHRRDFRHASTPLADRRLGAWRAAIGLYENGEMVIACAHGASNGPLGIYELQLAITPGAPAKVAVRAIDTLDRNTVVGLVFDPSTKALISCAMQGDLPVVEYWQPRTSSIATAKLFSGESESIRKVEWHSTAQETCEESAVAGLDMSSCGSMLAVLYTNGACDLRQSATLQLTGQHRPDGFIDPSTALTFSPNDVCIATTTTRASVKVIDCGTVPTEDGGAHATRLAKLYEFCMVRRCDWSDINLVLGHCGSNHLAAAVVAQLEHRFNVQKEPYKRLYLPILCAMTSSIYRMESRLANAIDADLRLLLEAVAASFRSCITPYEPQHLTTHTLRKRLDAADEVPLDEIVRHIRVGEGNVEHLQALSQWTVLLTVFVFKSVSYVAVCHPEARFDRESAAEFATKHGVLGLPILLDMDALNTLREVLLYSLSVRLTCEETNASLPRKGAYIKQMFKVYSDLRNRLSTGSIFDHDTAGPSLTCAKLRETLDGAPQWTNALSHSSYWPGVLLQRLNVLPDAEAATKPHPQSPLPTVIHMHAEREVLSSSATPILYDVVRHMALMRGATARQCIRCRRLTTAVNNSLMPWAEKWDIACICGGLWRKVKLP